MATKGSPAGHGGNRHEVPSGPGQMLREPTSGTGRILGASENTKNRLTHAADAAATLVINTQETKQRKRKATVFTPGERSCEEEGRQPWSAAGLHGERRLRVLMTRVDRMCTGPSLGQGLMGQVCVLGQKPRWSSSTEGCQQCPKQNHQEAT